MVTSPATASHTRTASVRNAWQIPSRLRADLTRMLAQQFWLFGFDIRRPDGNLLLAHGFTKSKPPERHPATCSRYSKNIPGGRISLWGFGVCLIDPARGNMFQPRQTFRPVFTPNFIDLDDRWSIDAFTDLAAPTSGTAISTCAMLMIDILTWFRIYETQVVARLGAPYRIESLATWKPRIGEPDALSRTWDNLIDELKRTTPTPSSS